MPRSATLPTVKQKEVEILKALALDARAIIMDEPTGWLAASEVAKLHATIRMLKARGVGIIYISHMLDEIFAVCDTMTIMRDGKVIAEATVAEIDRPRVVHLMVGEKLARKSLQATHQKRQPARHGRGPAERRRTSASAACSRTSASISMPAKSSASPGSIGSKRTELVRTLFGSDRFDSGTLEIDGKPVRVRVARRAPSPAASASCPRTGTARG